MYLGSDNYLGATAYLGAGGATPVPTGDETLIEWMDLVLHGREGRFTIQRVEGWDDLPGPRWGPPDRPAQHGTFDAPVYAGARHVVVTGLCVAHEQRDAMLQEMQRSMIFTAEPQELRIYRAGKQLSTAARLLRFRPTGEHWGVGAFPWAAEWVCADPYRYGPLQEEYTTLPTNDGGLRFPLFTDGWAPTGILEFGGRGSAGRVTVSNAGNAPGSPVLAVSGPAPAGFTVQHVETGRRIVSTTHIPEGSTLRVDVATGRVTLDGAERSLVVREWPTIPAGGSATLAFSAPVPTAASLVVEARDTWW